MRKELLSERFCLLRMTEAVSQRYKKVFLETSQNSHENTCARVFLFRGWSLFIKKLWHRRFPANFAKFLKTPIFQNTSGSCFCNEIFRWSRWNASIFWVKRGYLLLWVYFHSFQRGFEVLNAISQASVYVTIIMSPVYYNSTTTTKKFCYFVSSWIVNI